MIDIMNRLNLALITSLTIETGRERGITPIYDIKEINNAFGNRLFGITGSASEQNQWIIFNDIRFNFSFSFGQRNPPRNRIYEVSGCR
jgi:hypothetical protein